MNARPHGSQMMGRDKSNHSRVAYSPDAESANLALAAKATTFQRLGLAVNICGAQHGLRFRD